MVLVYYAIAILLGLAVTRFIKPTATQLESLARFFLVYSIVYFVAFVAYAFANLSPNGWIGLTIEWGKVLWYAVLAYLVVAAATSTPKTFSLILWAVAFTIGASFILSTIGKSIYLGQMKTFFLQSGYSVPFLYFIMSAEAAGGIGVLLHRWLKTGPWAAIGIFLIMIGAVYTHVHNHDPFSDAYAAITEMLTLTFLLFLYRLERRQTSTALAT